MTGHATAQGPTYLLERRERFLARVEGMRATDAESMPPGSICGLCARDLHRFVHPHSLPERHWSLMDGCPCCETHIGDEPPLGAGKAARGTDV